ncbi:MAG: peptidyl-prolyl cis-trans isomerase, partial [Fimbriimonadaceae bacterium]|nr:peptidyl-prolyl cis-trans isomerase [Alphaproteobacteria bacterium]
LEAIKIPEKREIQQIVFASEQEAREAAEKIAAGTDFALIGAEKGLADDDLSLGLVTAEEIFDPVVRDAAFALEIDKISDPVAGGLGHVLLRVTKIEAARTPALEEMHDALRDDLAAGLTQDRALDLFDTVEDDRAAGLTFQEIAAKNNVKYRVIDAIDADGKDTSGNAIGDLPQVSDVTGVTFDTDPGVEADPIQLADNGFLWVNVTDVTDSRDRTIDEVRDRLEERWRSAEQTTRMSEHAKMLSRRLYAGGTLEEIAVNNGIQVMTSEPLKRASTDDTFDQAVISAIFATPKGGADSALHANGTDRILFRVSDIALEPADPASEDSKELAESLTLSVSEDMLGTYVRLKQEKFGVSINQNNLDVLTGVASEQGQY